MAVLLAGWTMDSLVERRCELGTRPCHRADQFCVHGDGTRSNRALNFVVVAVAAGVVPIIYEMLNDNAPSTARGAPSR